ncbi:MAG: hypothetical protein ACLR7U_00570 [Ruthenibacterium lactatiformans]
MYYSVDALETERRVWWMTRAAVRSCLRQTCRPVRRRDVLEQRDGVWSAAPEETKRRKARAALLLQQILERKNAPGNGGSE